MTVVGASGLNANEWYVFDGISQHGPMSYAETIQFLKSLSHGDIASVWRPGLDNWKAATELFEVVTPDRLVNAPHNISSKRQYSLYGLYLGLTLNLADYLFEWRGAKFESWNGAGLGNNLGYTIGTIIACVAVAFVIGAAVDVWRTR